MDETIELIKKYLNDQNLIPKFYKQMRVEEEYNYEKIVHFELKSDEKSLIQEKFDDKVLKEICDFIFKSDEILEKDDMLWESTTYYFKNSRGAEKKINELYIYLQQNEILKIEEFIDEIFKYSIHIDINNQEVKSSSNLTQQIIEVLQRLEYKNSQILNTDPKNLIEKLKKLLYPENSEDSKNYEKYQQDFKNISNILHKKGYIIKVNNKEYHNFSQKNLNELANVKIRNSIPPEDRYDGGAVPWEARREFINTKMVFVPKKQFLSDDVVKVLEEISFINIDEGNLNQTLCTISNAIENKLKRGRNFVNLESCSKYKSKNKINELLTDENIKKYRGHLQCFRHHSDESIKERDNISENEKKSLIAYGHSILILINDIKN